MYKIINTEKIFEHKRITLLEDTIKLQDGQITDYLKFEEKANAATVIAKDDKGKILITTDYFHPQKERMWEFPGGHIPLDGDPKIGAVRELEEETGYRAKHVKLINWFYSGNTRREKEKLFVFEASDLTKTSQNLEPEESGIKLHWKTQKEIDHLVENGEIKNNNALAIWMTYKMKKN